MNDVEKVIKRLQREHGHQTWTVTLLGDKKNKASGFYIMMLSQGFSSTKKDRFYGINRKTLQALLDAKIEFKTDVKWV